MYFIGVDVGTTSVRAGVFNAKGNLCAYAQRAIAIWRAPGHIVEQSSQDIWQAVCASVVEAVANAKLEPDAIAGVGFDATCSLVVLDDALQPMAVGPSGDPQRNIIVWMDHRAEQEAADINKLGHRVLDYVGGRISPEMQTPKLLWLKRHKPATYRQAAHFLDLADYLTFATTGSLTRSICTLTCKWTYLAHEKAWSADYFARIGLEDLAGLDDRRIGADVVTPGTPVGTGLSEAAAKELGLRAGTPVAAALIDAHAGALGTLGGRDSQGELADPMRRMALIMGTSACCIALAAKPIFVDGVWGPYFQALVPGLWIAEGGQSAAGAALDHLLAMHPAYPALAKATGGAVLPALEARIAREFPDLSEAARLADTLHVMPDLLGNRSPFADAQARGVVCGLDLSCDQASLASLYIAVLCGLSYGIGQIADALEAKGYVIDDIVVSGGASHSPLVRKIMADATRRSITVPKTQEPVLLGSAILAATAAGAYPTVTAAMQAMAQTAQRENPAVGPLNAFHASKREVFLAMQRMEREARAIMAAQAPRSA
jgi:D-ribulokinase